jgi:hypothetical protein
LSSSKKYFYTAWGFLQANDNPNPAVSIQKMGGIKGYLVSLYNKEMFDPFMKKEKIHP